MKETLLIEPERSVIHFEGLKGEKTKGLKAALKFAKEHDMCMTEAQIQGANNM